LLPLLIPKAGVHWEGALILSIIYLTFFLWQAWILRGKPTTALGLPAFLRVIHLAQTRVILLDKLVSFLFYLLFVGPGEEFLFGSYFQSRLNAAFNRRFSFWGVPFSWGLVITALIYGLMHVLNLFNPFLGKFEFYIW
jgi:membrane protease YdiL (CAAX protease family)